MVKIKKKSRETIGKQQQLQNSSNSKMALTWKKIIEIFAI